MAAVTVNGCQDVTLSKDDPGGTDGDRMVNCGNKITNNHADDIKGEDSISDVDLSSQDNKSIPNKQDVSLLNHKEIGRGLLVDEHGTGKHNSEFQNVNGTKSQDSLDIKDTDKSLEDDVDDDKYSGFGIRPHNVDKEDETMDSPPRMVFSLAGFAPLNDRDEEKNKEEKYSSVKESLDTDTVEKDSDVEIYDEKDDEMNKLTDQKDNLDKVIDQKDDELEKVMDQKNELETVDKKDDEVDKVLDEKVDELDEKVDELDKSHKTVNEKDDEFDKGVEDGKLNNVDEEMDDIVEKNQNKSIGEEMADEKDKNVDQEMADEKDKSVDQEMDICVDDKKDKIVDNEKDKNIDNEIDISSEVKNLDNKVDEDSRLDNEGCSDKEDLQNEDLNDSVVILDEEESDKSGDQSISANIDESESKKGNKTGVKKIEEKKKLLNDDNEIMDIDEDIEKSKINEKCEKIEIDQVMISGDEKSINSELSSEVKIENSDTVKSDDRQDISEKMPKASRKSIEKVIIDGSEIVITINEDESGDDDSGKDADDESDGDDDDDKERKKKIHSKTSPIKSPNSQDKNRNDNCDKDLVVLDGSPTKEDGMKDEANKNPAISEAAKQVIQVPSGTKTILAYPQGYMPSQSANSNVRLPSAGGNNNVVQYFLPTTSAQMTGTKPIPGSQYFKVMGQGQQAFYMPVSSQYVVSNTSGTNQPSVVNRAGQNVNTVAVSDRNSQLSVVKPTSEPSSAASESVLSKKVDDDIASSSWEQLELVKYDIATKKPDNTFWMGLANVNKKADLSSVTKFLFDLGSDIVKESAYRQIISVQNKKLDAGRLNNSEMESLEKMKSVVKDLKEKVGHLDLKQMKCKGCGYQSSSKNVMRLHNEYPHMSPPNDMYGVLNCVHCQFSTKIPTAYTYHMNVEHNINGRLYDKPAFHQCNLCLFENNSKPKLTQHSIKCTKNYKPHLNQAPYYFDISYCLKNIFYKFQIKKPQPPKPETRTKAIPAKPPMIQPKGMTRTPVYTGQPTRPQVGGRFVLGPNQNVYRLNVPGQSQYHQQFQQFALAAPNQRPVVRPPARPPVRPLVHPTLPFKQSPRPDQTYRPVQFTGKPTVGELLKQQKSAVQKGVSPAARPQIQPRPQVPTKPKVSQPPAPNQGGSGGFEVCEMCGGYVKDKMSLRIHFYYAHKIDMPASIFNRQNPPLTCEVCKKKFWTTQGLSKHKQSMKHNINSKPSQQSQAMCWICHQKPDNLYSHLHKFHKLTTSECMALKRCMFCGTLCSTRKELEIHMAAAHGVLIKGEGTKPNSNVGSNSTNSNSNVPKVNVSTRTVVTGSGGSKGNPGLVRNNFCVFCAKQFTDNTQLTLHCLRDHATCSGCGMVVAKASDLKSHICKMNRSKNCEICGIKNLKSVYYTKHVSTHLKKCRVKVKRLSQQEISQATKRRKTNNVVDNIEIISDSQSDDESSKKEIKNSMRMNEKDELKKSDGECEDKDLSKNTKADVKAEDADKKMCDESDKLSSDKTDELVAVEKMEEDVGENVEGNEEKSKETKFEKEKADVKTEKDQSESEEKETEVVKKETEIVVKKETEIVVKKETEIVVKKEPEIVVKKETEINVNEDAEDVNKEKKFDENEDTKVDLEKETKVNVKDEEKNDEDKSSGLKRKSGDDSEKEEDAPPPKKRLRSSDKKND